MQTSRQTFVFVMDPIESIDIETDTTFVLMLEAQRRGHRALYADPADLAIDAGGSMLYAIEPLAGVSRSDLSTALSGQIAWQRLGFGELVAEDGYVHDVAFDPVDPDIAYVLKQSDGIFKTQPTTDGTVRWVSVRVGFDSGEAGAEGDLSLFARQLTIDPFKRNNVYVGGSRLWASPNGGAEWTELANLPVLGAASGALAADPYRSGAESSVERPAIGRRSSEAQIDCVNLLIPGPAPTPTRREAVADDSLPTTETLLHSVARYLREQYEEEGLGRDRFLARVAANSLGIAGRDLSLGPPARRAEHARLRELLDSDAGLGTLRARLCDALRDGSMPLDTPGLADHLRSTVAEQVRIDQPDYHGLATALAFDR